MQGARQTGKTYIIKAFGRNEYENVVYCNFEEEPGLDDFFKRDLNPERILAELSIYYKIEKRPFTRMQGVQNLLYIAPITF